MLTLNPQSVVSTESPSVNMLTVHSASSHAESKAYWGYLSRDKCKSHGIL